jgi:micrococcal nuclease
VRRTVLYSSGMLKSILRALFKPSYRPKAKPNKKPVRETLAYKAGRNITAPHDPV